MKNDASHLIYPSHLKYEESRKMPYLALIDQLNRFIRKKSSLLILSGYSFNDGHLNDAINLLISMLHALDIEAYFVLVPKHIFVIVPLEDSRLVKTKGLWVNSKKHYILESTAKDSGVGYALRYDLSEIDVIIEPFSNEKLEIKNMDYKL